MVNKPPISLETSLAGGRRKFTEKGFQVALQPGETFVPKQVRLIQIERTVDLDLQGVAVSTGSACSSGSLEPSPIIRALGKNDEMARGAIRFSFGKDNSPEDVQYVSEVLPKAIENLRRLSPLYAKQSAK